MSAAVALSRTAANDAVLDSAAAALVDTAGALAKIGWAADDSETKKVGRMTAVGEQTADGWRQNRGTKVHNRVEVELLETEPETADKHQIRQDYQSQRLHLK